MEIEFLGATREVTGSCFLLRVADQQVLVDCGLVQGSRQHERHNSDEFSFDPEQIDAVILTHAHIDHSGRLPLLVKRGYRGPVYTHTATVDLCAIMLEDAGYLNEREAEWENRKRARKGLELLEPLYTRQEARASHRHFKALDFGQPQQILPGVRLTLHDAGHILGSAIVVLDLEEGGHRRKVVFSGDLGHHGAPILRDPERVPQADLVVLESTYGDRRHRDWESTWEEMRMVLSSAHAGKGNILVPAFTVGRTQELLYIFNSHYEEWGVGDWQIFLDSPMGIEATEIYDRHSRVYDIRARDFARERGTLFGLPNLRMTERAEESMQINTLHAGAIIIAGSGMCTGGRIKHHLKHNIWRRDAHVMIVGFQARGTLGRALVDGASHIRLWGETIKVQARVHTVGGLSAHADQQGLLDWYGQIEGHPPVVLVHGEPDAMDTLAAQLQSGFGGRVTQAEYRQKLPL
jgi:metallo-beta-lactamase family protein